MFEHTITEFFNLSARKEAPLLLELQSIVGTPENTDPAPYRTTTFKLIKKKNTDNSVKISWSEVGEIVLIENVGILAHTGQFHLELLHIYESFSGQGLGGIALGQLKTLAKQLASQSSFYQTLSLLSADVYIEKKLLPIVPRRVKFYMDNGFVLHSKTIELMKFLSLKHFIDRLNPDHFFRYLVEYNLISDEMFTYRTKKAIKTYASSVLTELQASDDVPSLSQDMILAYVKTHGSICTKNILDRAFYDAHVTDTEQETFDKYLYYMTLDVTGQDNLGSQISTYTETLDPSFLQEAPWNDNFTLLPDQIKLNYTIQKMLLEEYKKDESKKRKPLSRRSSNRTTKKPKKWEDGDDDNLTNSEDPSHPF